MARGYEFSIEIFIFVIKRFEIAISLKISNNIYIYILIDVFLTEDNVENYKSFVFSD